MELYKELLITILKDEEVEVKFPNLNVDVDRILELYSYKALKAIKKVLEDDTLDDKECFHKIEEIVCIFEELGSGGGGRHDFG